MGLINSPFMIQSDRRVNAFVQIFPTSLVKQVGGYMRPDNLQLHCVKPPTSSYNFQLPHGRHCHHGRHGHVGHGGQGEHGGHGGYGGQERTKLSFKLEIPVQF